MTVIEVVALETLVVYPVVALLKVGESVPVPKARPVRSVLTRATVKVYVLVFAFWAVTTVLMILGPIARLIGALSLPEFTTIPLTFTVAVASATVGVMVIDVVAL